MNAEVLIRPRLDSDLSRAASVLVEVHGTDGYPVEGVERPMDWLTPHGVLGAWIAEAGGEVIGHALLTAPSDEGAVELWRQVADGSPDIAVLGRLFVAPSARGRAVGERLVRAAMDHGAKHGLRLLLDVMVKDTAAIRLYERLGWQELGRVAHGFGAGSQIDAIAYVAPAAPKG